MRVTINDIARASGFSKTTVSFAFNEPDRISKTTREKILDLAERLGYVPDPIARNLSKRRLGTIGLLLPQVIPEAFENPYLAQVIRGAGAACSQEGYSITLVSPLRGCLFRAVRSAAVDGFIALGLEPAEDLVRLIRKRNVPLVNIDGGVSVDVPSVGIDDRKAAEEAMRYVLAAGHRTIGILGFKGVTRNGTVTYSGMNVRRLSGYADALESVGLSLHGPGVRHVNCACSTRGGYLGALHLLSLKGSPTAIVAMSDIMALGAYQAAREKGIRIPEELSVVGFDDIPEAQLVTPRLTTLSQPGYEKGLTAGRMLLELVRHGNEPVTRPAERLPAELAVRESVAPPASAG